MMPAQFEIMVIAAIVAAACALPGVFLVLRGMALMSDAISHAVLLGVVVSFFWIQDLQSPLLMVGASFAGILTVALTELLVQSKRLKQDAAIGLVFPVFFSLGVILISRYAGNIHLDTDAVLLGELAFAPFHRLTAFGFDIGPYAMWTMGIVLLINSLFVSIFYKELKLVTFDSSLASALGFYPVALHYLLMTLTSITAVGAFDAVGSILVVALMITPAACAYLLTERLSTMIGLSVGIGIFSAISGFGLATALDASIAGSMATMCGVLFTLILIFSPGRGLLMKLLKARSQRLLFASRLLCVQLFSHENQPDSDEEATIDNMIIHMGWKATFAKRVSQLAVQKELIFRQGRLMYLTPLGRETAKVIMLNSQMPDTLSR
jgi:manganese/zinc/iron transport system permease protein